MIQTAVHYLKVITLFLLNLIHRCEKFAQFLISNKHEFERICEAQCDTYEKTFRLEQWLAKTNCEKIRDFWNEQFETKRDEIEHSFSSAQRAIDKVLAHYTSGDRDENISGVINTNPKLRKAKSKGRNQTYRTKIVNLDEGDDILSQALMILTIDFVRLIKKTKRRPKLASSCEAILCDLIYRILSYKLTLIIAERLASTKYDPTIDSHVEKLMSLWNNLVNTDTEQNSNDLKRHGDPVIKSEYSYKITSREDIVSSRWSNIGFQGEDPGTDFRGMGLLGLEQLEYLSRRPNNLSIYLLRQSLSRKHEYPWAIVGINITYNLLLLFRDGSMKHLYYDDGEYIFRNKKRNLNVLKTYNNLYIELFLRFDCFWQESKPENIFAFRGVIGKFVDVIKTDLCNRNFTFKFIY